MNETHCFRCKEKDIVECSSENSGPLENGYILKYDHFYLRCNSCGVEFVDRKTSRKNKLTRLDAETAYRISLSKNSTRIINFKNREQKSYGYNHENIDTTKRIIIIKITNKDQEEKINQTQYLAINAINTYQYDYKATSQYYV